MPRMIEPFAREAFAAGWAASGGPMTERVRCACAVAVELAVEHADRLDILEVTLQLGKLEGMWARLFQRREALVHDYTQQVNAAWAPLIKPRLLRDGARQFHASTPPGTDRDAVMAAAVAAARAMLQGLPLAPGWADLRQTIRNALAAGQAEGMLGAVAIAADRAGRDGLDWDAGFQRAYQQLERLDALWSQAEQWLSRLVERAIAALARVLAAKALAGAADDELLDAGVDDLTDEGTSPVGFTTDWAMTAAMGLGALALYRLNNAVSISWITAGDGRVCQLCDDNETAGPYSIDDVPAYPAHPRCRCQLAADFDLSRFADWFTT